jgi:hypothetical protein
MSGLDEPWAMKEAHLQELAGKVRETLTLDYKASEALARNKTDEISKDVSAFANSAGGVIIYGMREMGKSGFAEIDSGVDPNEISAEWLENVISSNIRPRIMGVRINQVYLNIVSPKRVAYIVYVPQSQDAHQAADRRYYKRLEFKSEPMYDHEIRDIMNRRLHPKIVPSVWFRLGVPEEGSRRRSAPLQLTLRNESSIRATEIKFELYVPVRSYIRAPFKVAVEEVDGVKGSNQINHIRSKKISWRISETIFPRDEKMITDASIGDLVMAFDPSDPAVTRRQWIEYISYRCFADDAPVEHADIALGHEHHLS